MRYDKFIKNIAYCTSIIALVGCNDATYSEIENRIYISEAAPSDSFNQQTVNLTVAGTTTTTMHIRVAHPVDHDITVALGYDPESMEAYNARNNTGFVQLDEQYVSFPATATIAAGTLAANPVDITINEFPTGSGESFCVPIKIMAENASVPVARTTGHLLYLLSTPLRQVVPTMDKNTFPTGTEDWNISTSAWTLEGWVWMDSFRINNQAIFYGSVSQGTEIYIRFGDADLDYDKLQIKTGGSQFNSNKAFSPNTWYHLAITYTNGKCTLYINGEEDASKEFAATNYVINNLTLCASESYFRANAKMAQIRFWKKALSANAIKDAMHRQVPSSSDGLFGYWKLDEGEGNVFHDSSGSGFDLTCRQQPRWDSEEIDFTNPNK